MATTATEPTCCVCGRELHCDATKGTLETWTVYWDGKTWCGPCCQAAHERLAAERKAAAKARRERGKAEGMAYWQARGIAVGARLKRFVVSWTGIQATWAYGVAKIGTCGAYVKSEFQRGKLAPDGWNLAE